MSKNLIYIDHCSLETAEIIQNKLCADVVLRLPDDKWNINDTMGIITMPSLELAVITAIDEIAVMEMALLYFMCKPILVTTKLIKNYKKLESTVVDYIEPNCNINDPDNTFITWYKKVFWRTNG